MNEHDKVLNILFCCDFVACIGQYMMLAAQRMYAFQLEDLLTFVALRLYTLSSPVHEIGGSCAAARMCD
jgi:hypothetical protein